MTAKTTIVVVGDASDSRAKILAEQISLPLHSTRENLPSECSAYLAYHDDRLQLFPVDAKQSGPVCVDFASDAANYRLQSGGELIVKAVKGRSKNSLRIIDATAGLGRDSFVLAAHGFTVTAIERNTFVAALLHDGLQRAAMSSAAEIAARMQLVQRDALTYLSELPVEQSPDVIYLDPMFAHTEKAALVKKEMRLFRQLLGDDVCDEAALLAAARRTATLRVVVKRAIKADYLAGMQPGYSLSGKAIRFDVYPS